MCFILFVSCKPAMYLHWVNGVKLFIWVLIWVCSSADRNLSHSVILCVLEKSLVNLVCSLLLMSLKWNGMRSQRSGGLKHNTYWHLPVVKLANHFQSTHTFHACLCVYDLCAFGQEEKPWNSPCNSVNVMHFRVKWELILGKTLL